MKLLLSTALLIFASLGIATTCTADWIAGRDMSANERPNGPQELVNPNPTVPEWSYGYRSTVAGTALTLFVPSEHYNDGSGYAMNDGWGRTGGLGPNLAVNAGASPIIYNYGLGPLEPVDPQEMTMHPQNNGTLAVLRWTAPYAGTFTIDAYWDDLDTHGGGGGDGHIVVNGTSIYDALWGNGGGSVTTQSVTLNTLDTVDFMLGSNGNYDFDTTAVGASITAVPEPCSLLISFGLAASAFAFRCRQRS